MGSLDQGPRCELFGAVRAWHGDTELDLGPLRQRLVLAALLAAGGEPVSMGMLVDLVWETDPPASAVNMLHRHVGELRRILEPGMLTRATGQWLLPAGDGYWLAADSDLLAFRRQQRQGRDLAAAGKQAEALACYAAALAIARGPAAGDLGSPAGQHPAFTAIDRERTDAAVAAADSALAAEAEDDGAARDLLQVLRSVAVTDPLNEQLYARLILLLHRAGNSAAALTVFGEIRARLADELGIDPGPELRAAHQHVLQGGGAQAVPQLIPAQLPAGTALFAGRKAELAEATALAHGGGAAATVLITAIGGLAGIGKTTFAVHWAHHIAARFPDGQLYVNLRGFDPGGAPVARRRRCAGSSRRWTSPPAAHPGRPGRAGRAVPQPAGRAGGCWWCWTTPATPSRSGRCCPAPPAAWSSSPAATSLAGLVATDGARPLPLGPAVQRRSPRTAGPAPRRDAPGGRAVGRRGDHRACARPAAGAGCRRRPGGDQPWPSARRARRRAARDAGSRPDAFTDSATSGRLRAVFSWSYRLLSPAAARTVPAARGCTRAGHLAPGGGQPGRPAAARGPAPCWASWPAASMITESAPGRYAFHDLLRAYAAERLDTDDPQGREEAQARLIDHYMHSAQAAYRRYATPPFAVPDPDRPGVIPEGGHTGSEEAMRWYVTEMPVLFAVFDLAVATGADRRGVPAHAGVAAAEHLHTAITQIPPYATTAARIAESLDHPDLAAEVQLDLGARYEGMGPAGLGAPALPTGTGGLHAARESCWCLAHPRLYVRCPQHGRKA